MKKEDPYNKSLGDKMEQLPLPDMQHNWQEMRKLLDNEMPRGGGYSKRRGGWWLFGTVLLFVITGSWMIGTMNFGHQSVDPPVTKQVNISPPQPDEIAANELNQSEKPNEQDDQILHREKEQVTDTDTKSGEKDTESDEMPAVSKTGNSPGAKNSGANASVESVSGENASRENAIPGTRDSKPGINSRKSTGIRGSNAGLNNRGRGNTTKAGSTAAGITGGSVTGEDASPTAADELQYTTPTDQFVADPAGSVASQFDSADISRLPVIDYTTVSRKWIKEHRRYANPPNVRAPYTTEGRTFAFGFSLPLGFPLGDQKMLGYNVNAGPNTASDYLPVPHLQYHFSGKSYIQSELQFMTPQFIKPVLLEQSYHSYSNYTITNSVTARKLYYFNLPVSVHYSPFRHFYMGTGLQLSSLLSGVAMNEEIKRSRVTAESYQSITYSKFKNDKVSEKLNSTEMRVMLDANYYWHKFTVGLRYNQAVNNYVNLRVTPTTPYVLDKNKSLQFYMRYNLWEEKKRGVSTRQLTHR